MKQTLARTLNRFASTIAPLKAVVSTSRGVQFLSAVLVLQLLVAGGLGLQSGLQQREVPPMQLVELKDTVINQIEIDDGESQVTLTRTDDQWRLDDKHVTMADSDKVNEMLSTIQGLSLKLPVANTTRSHAQLKVSDDEFERKLILKSENNTVAELILGTSPGFKKTHVRSAGRDEVYALALSAFDVPANQDAWLDKDLLAFSDISSIQSNDLQLAKTDEQWSIAEPQELLISHEVVDTQMSSFLDELAGLRVTGLSAPLVATDPLSDYIAHPDEQEMASADGDDLQADQLLTHQLTVVEEGVPVTLTLSKLGSKATIERSDTDGVFALATMTFDALSHESIEATISEKNVEEPADGDIPNG